MIEDNPLPLGRCVNVLRYAVICGEQVYDDDSDWQKIDSGLLCSNCVNRILSKGVNDLPVDGRGFKGKSKVSRRSTFSTLGKARTRPV